MSSPRLLWPHPGDLPARAGGGVAERRPKGPGCLAHNLSHRPAAQQRVPNQTPRRRLLKSSDL